MPTTLSFKHLNGVPYSHVESSVPVVDICPLCLKRSELVASHINPKWSWMKNKKETKSEGKLIQLQGGEWFYLLCGPCDRFLGVYEESLAYASKKQPSGFEDNIKSGKISTALIGVLWKASLASKRWKGTKGWSQERDDWARDLLRFVQINKGRGFEAQGLERANDAVHWRGIKFFSESESNPFNGHGTPALDPNPKSIGVTFLAGILWVVGLGRGKLVTQMHLWDGVEDPYFINSGKEQEELLNSLRDRTDDEDPCPCGRFFMDKSDNKLMWRYKFAYCCKREWLSNPLVGFRYFIPPIYIRAWFLPSGRSLEDFSSEEDLLAATRDEGIPFIVKRKEDGSMFFVEEKPTK